MILIYQHGCKPKRNAQNIALCVIKSYAQLAKGGGGMPQFSYYSMQLYDSGDPKGGAMAQWPPLNTPLYRIVYNRTQYKCTFK